MELIDKNDINLDGRCKLCGQIIPLNRFYCNNCIEKHKISEQEREVKKMEPPLK